MEVEIVILLTLITTIKTEVCQKVSACSCKTSEGVVDLSALPGSVSANDEKYKNTWFTCSAGTCGTFNGVSICQTQLTPPENSFINGYFNTSTFSGEPEKNLVLTYTGDTISVPGGTQIRTSRIALVCDKTADVNTFIAEGEQPPVGSVNYKFTLRSKHACIVSSGISVGSVLLILFFVFVLIYVIGGILFLRFYRGASGVEMFPNYEFWKDLPFLIKDGMVFTFRGCKTDTTYSQI
ncbi:cation-dependent mannose-6-phosphate receptor-like [Crassostrea virginica]